MKYLLILAVALCACPNLPPVAHCTPFVHSCVQNRPYVCSSSQRWEPSGDLASCDLVRGVCVVLPDGRAGCSVVPDAGTASDAGVGGDR